MARDFEKLLNEARRMITLQYDYPANGQGSIGFRGHNMYRFRTEDAEAIQEFLKSNADEFRGEYNAAALAQEMLSCLLDEGLIEYGGYGYKEDQKKNFSI